MARLRHDNHIKIVCLSRKSVVYSGMQIGTFFIDLSLDPHTVLCVDEIDWDNMIVWATDQDGNGFEVPFGRMDIISNPA